MSMLDTPQTVRRSKFKRAAPAPMRLTDDDLAIIRHIARHRFLRSTHLALLMPHRSYKKLLERLAALYHNGFVDRPRAQLDYYATAGSAPIVYALGNRGALALAERDGMDRAQVDWTWKNRSVGRPYVEHTLLTADLMVAAEGVTRRRPDVKLISATAMLAAAPETTSRADNPLKLTARANHAGKLVDVSVIPDAVFGLDFTVERKRKYFFLEADRATMPIVRADLNQTSYMRKLLAYLDRDHKWRAHRKHDRCTQAAHQRSRIVTVSVCRSLGAERQHQPALPRMAHRERRGCIPRRLTPDR